MSSPKNGVFTLGNSEAGVHTWVGQLGELQTFVTVSLHGVVLVSNFLDSRFPWSRVLFFGQEEGTLFREIG